MSYAFLKNQDEMSRLDRQAEESRERETRLLASLGVPKHARVLEAGCGPGFISVLLGSFFRDGKVVSYDLREDLLVEAREKCRQLPNVMFRQGNFTQLPEPDNSQDLVYCRLALSHVSEPVKALGEFRRVLKPGGILCIVDIDDRSVLCEPAYDGLSLLLKSAAKRQAKMGGDRFIGAKLQSYFTEAGFQTSEVQLHPFSVHVPEQNALVDIYLQGRLAYLTRLQQRVLENWMKRFQKALAKRTAFLAFTMFVGVGRK